MQLAAANKPGAASRASAPPGRLQRAPATARFGNAGTSALLVRRAPVGPAAAPAASGTAKVSAGADEVERSRRSPGRFSVSVNPRSITLYDFAIDVAEPKAAHRAALANMVAGMKAQRPAPTAVTLDSYTDDTGTEAHNYMLSLRRGLAVGALLGGIGIPLLQSPHGERDTPPNDTPAQRSRNRRVVVTFRFAAAARKPPVPVPPQPNPQPEPDDTPNLPVPCDLVSWMCEDVEPPPPCDLMPWLCEETGTRSICDQYPFLCLGDLPILPLLPLACRIKPELCAAIHCVLNPSDCLPTWPFDDDSDPDRPDRPDERCDRGELGRNLNWCESEWSAIEQLCGRGLVVVDVLSPQARVAAEIACAGMRAAKRKCRERAIRQAHCDEKPPAGKLDCCEKQLGSVPIEIDDFHALKVQKWVTVHDGRVPPKHSRNIKPASPGVECDVAFLGAVALDTDRSKYGPCLGKFGEALDKKDADYGGQMGSDSAAGRGDIVKTVIERGTRIRLDTFWGNARRPVGIDVATGNVTAMARISGVPNRAHIIPQESRPT